jgi:hypothetical protein
VYNVNYNNLGSPLQTGEAAEARTGRIGIVFIVVALLCFMAGNSVEINLFRAHLIPCVLANKLYFPKEATKREKEIDKKRTYLAEKEEIWNPVLWKKSNFALSAFFVGVVLVLLVEYSLSINWNLYMWQSLIVLKVIYAVMDVFIVHQLQDKMLCSPLRAVMSVATGLITIGGPNYAQFLFQYLIELVYTIFERCYLDIYSNIGINAMLRVQIFTRFYVEKYTPKFLKKKEVPDVRLADLPKAEMEGVYEKMEEAESVEPILVCLGDYCSDTAYLIYFIYVIFLFMEYRDQIQLPIQYGIRQSDMFIYLVFQTTILPFQFLADVFIQNQLELFHGYKIYEYLVYTHYRFLQRETRWKGMEDSMDECIDDSLRSLDQMCFSSQYYFMLTVMLNGIVYVILAHEIWLHASGPVNYTPFADPMFLVILLYMFAVYIVLENILVYASMRLGLWKIKHENTAWHMQQDEEDDLDVPGWDEIRGASHDAFLLNQRITSETFRNKFLNYNRAWLINQLPNLLTPRTLRRSRPYLINQLERILNKNQGDISGDSEDDDKRFGPVALTQSSRKIIRWWLEKARRRLRLKQIVDPLIRKARREECEICLSRKQLHVEHEVDMDSMISMYDAQYPDEEVVDQAKWKSFWNDKQVYHTYCLACISLRKKKEKLGARKIGDFLGNISDDDKQEEYPEWGPVFLSAASKAIMLDWYRKAQRRMQSKRGTRQRKPKVMRAVSDDEGEPDAPQWAMQRLDLSAATRAIAIKWMRTARARMQRKAGKGADASTVRTLARRK